MGDTKPWDKEATPLGRRVARDLRKVTARVIADIDRGKITQQDGIEALINALAAVGPSVAIGGEIYDAEVNADHLGSSSLRRLCRITGHGQVELATHQHQIDLTFLGREQRALGLATGEGHAQSAGDGPNRYLVPSDEAEHVPVERLRPVRAESPALRHPSLVGVCDLRDALTGRACTHASRLRGAVGEVVQRELAERLSIPRNPRHCVARLVAAPERLRKHAVLFGRRQELDGRNQFHGAQFSTNRSAA